MAFEIPNKWPLVTNVQSRNSGTNTTLTPTPANIDARLVNCFAERQADGNYDVEKRPGCRLRGYPVVTGTARGIYRWQNDTYYVISGFIYRSGAVLAAVNNNLFYRWQEINSVPRQLVFGNTLDSYYISGGVVNLIADVNFIGNLPGNILAFGWAYLDGTLYAMDTSCNIQGSAINNPAVWPATNLIVANSEPGDGVAIWKHLSYVLALKTANVEVFYNAGNPVGSPLARVPGAFIPMGCASGSSVAEIDGMLFWVGYNKNNELRVVKLENLNLQVISTPAVNRLLAHQENPGPDFRGFGLKICGHRFYVLVPSATVPLDFSLIYDIDQNLWYEWTNEVFSVGTQWAFASAAYEGTTVVAQGSDGQVYIIEPDYINPTDLNQPFTVDIYTPNFDAGLPSRKKALSQMAFEADRRRTILQVRYNDHDYAPDRWSNFVKVDLNAARPLVNRQGSFYRRAYNFRHYGVTPFRIKNVHLQMALGTS